MKKVIFICLLSISMCLSVPAGEGIPKVSPSPSVPSTQGTPPPQTAPPAKEPEKNTTGNETAKPPAAVVPPSHNETINGTAVTPTKAPKEASNNTVPTEKPAPAPAADNTKPATTTVAPAEGKPKNETAAGKEGKINGTTVVVNPSSTPAPTLKSRAFDGPSFVGGIILTLGLLAIGFMGFKYYKNQTERNYHTL